MHRIHPSIWIIAAALAASGCEKQTEVARSAAPAAAPAPEKKAPEIASDKGVDVEKKVVTVGALNDESGPAAAIGKPYALGKRVLVARINAGGSGLLPEGWKVELLERDHGYNPQNAVQAYNEIKDQVLFVATSFGTTPTLPLRPMLEQDGMLAFGASLSSQMAQNEHTPPIGPSYLVEAKRAMDWAVESLGGPAKVKPAIVYQQDDYGADGLAGWEQAAEHHKVKIVARQTIAPGQKDFTAVVTALKNAGANVVLLSVLPSSAGPILGTASQLKYQPTWIGNTPTWSDRFQDPKVIPPAVFSRYYQCSGLPYWGEKLPGMDDFLKAWETYGKEAGGPDFYILVSYLQGLQEMEILRKAIEARDVTRAGFKRAARSLDGWTAGGLSQPLSLTRLPYVTSTRTRILAPDLEGKGWKEVAPYAEPKAP